MAMTKDERHAQITAMLKDPELALTPREAFELIYHWMRFEVALIRLNRQDRRVEKQAQWLADITTVYNMRKSLVNL